MVNEDVKKIAQEIALLYKDAKKRGEKNYVFSQEFEDSINPFLTKATEYINNKHREYEETQNKIKELSTETYRDARRQLELLVASTNIVAKRDRIYGLDYEKEDFHLELDGKSTSMATTISFFDVDIPSKLVYIKLFKKYYDDVIAWGEEWAKDADVKEYLYLQREREEALSNNKKTSKIDKQINKLLDNSASVFEYTKCEEFIRKNEFIIPEIENILAKTAESENNLKQINNEIVNSTKELKQIKKDYTDNKNFMNEFLSAVTSGNTMKVDSLLNGDYHWNIFEE